MLINWNKTKLLPCPSFYFLGLFHVQTFLPGRNLSLRRGLDFGTSFQSPHHEKKLLVLIFIWHFAKPAVLLDPSPEKSVVFCYGIQEKPCTNKMTHNLNNLCSPHIERMGEVYHMLMTLIGLRFLL